MARNVEIKARLADPAATAARAAALADAGPVDIEQDDTFFGCAAGRFKLRTLGADAGELIFYRRDDAPGPKTSYYVKTPVTALAGLREALGQAYGVVGRVRKQRRLYLTGRTRIHLDNVERLGHFLELEVVLADGEAPAAGVREAEALLAQLGVAPEDRVAGAYVDLLPAAGA